MEKRRRLRGDRLKKQIVATLEEESIEKLDEFARSHVRSRAWAVRYFIMKGLVENGSEETGKNQME